MKLIVSTFTAAVLMMSTAYADKMMNMEQNRVQNKVQTQSHDHPENATPKMKNQGDGMGMMKGNSPEKMSNQMGNQEQGNGYGQGQGMMQGHHKGGGMGKMKGGK